MPGFGRNYGGYTATPGSLREQRCGRLASTAGDTSAPDVAESSTAQKSPPTIFILLLAPAIIFLSGIFALSSSCRRTAIRCCARLDAIKRKRTGNAS